MENELEEVEIEGVPVKALLDTGAQSTIISRATLHAIVKTYKPILAMFLNYNAPLLVRLARMGKGGKALYITAQVPFVFSLGRYSVTVPTFIQPDSEQACLLGMNAIPLLGIEVKHGSGMQLLPVEALTDTFAVPVISTVNLLTSTAIPSHKRCVMQVQSSPDISDGEFLFEPNHKVLETYGLSAIECLVTAAKGKVLLPVENFQAFMAHVDAGEEMGTVRPFDIGDPNANSVNACISVVVKKVPSPERVELLLSSLNLTFNKLTSEEAKQLKTLIHDFSDVFTLSDSELGCTA